MNICRKCGAVLRDGDKFCSKCGARAPSAKAEERKQKAQQRKQQKEITFRTKPAQARGYRENFEAIYNPNPEELGRIATLTGFSI